MYKEVLLSYLPTSLIEASNFVTAMSISLLEMHQLRKDCFNLLQDWIASRHGGNLRHQLAKKRKGLLGAYNLFYEGGNRFHRKKATYGFNFVINPVIMDFHVKCMYLPKEYSINRIIKWDGYRSLAYVNCGEVQLRSRNNLSFNGSFMPVVDALRQWGKSYC